MAAQRPKRNNSPINSKYQPLKATVPLSSLVRNTSPTRRRTSPSSPASSGIPPDKNRSRALLSPLGSKVNLFKPVNKTKAPKNIRRTNSLETLSSYINGQWPRENPNNPTSPPASVNNQQYAISKSTQTPFQWDENYEESSYPGLDHRKTSSIGAAGSKEIFRECLKRTKQNSAQPYHGKQSPLQGDHSAVSSSFYTASKPMSIPQVPSSPKYPSLHTRRSVEGLNIELEGLELGNKEEYVFARTPPKGRRPPVPISVDMQTQTENSTTFSPPFSRDKRSQSLSPSWPVIPGEEENISPIKEPITPNRSLSADSAIQSDTRESPDTGTTLVSKFASSPKPNNSFWFARGPPDGAEKVTLVEDIESSVSKVGCSSCPDTTKVTIQFSKDSPFCSLPPDYLCKTKKVT